MVTKLQIEKTTVYLLIFSLIQFSDQSFLTQSLWLVDYNEWKKDGVPMLVGELEPFFNWLSSLSRQIRHVLKSSGARARTNDAINYAQ